MLNWNEQTRRCGQLTRHRLELYAKQTAPLIEWYGERDLLEVVDGLGTTDEVTARLIAAVDARAAG